MTTDYDVITSVTDLSRTAVCVGVELVRLVSLVPGEPDAGACLLPHGLAGRSRPRPDAPSAGLFTLLVSTFQFRGTGSCFCILINTIALTQCSVGV